MSGPLVVAYGMGVDSTAMLVGLHQRGVRPDLILHADTGNEWPETYAYRAVIEAWLLQVGFPAIKYVENDSPQAGHKSLGDSLLTLNTAPAPAYSGGKSERTHTCSIVWKIDPQMKFIKGQPRKGVPAWQPAQDAWARGELVEVAVGYDNGPADTKRAEKAYGKAQAGIENWYPLQQWGWDRERCKREIALAGLPVPRKSSCYFCPMMKAHEVEELAAKHPQLAATALEIERRAKAPVGLKKDGTPKQPFERAGLGLKWNWADHLAARGIALVTPHHGGARTQEYVSRSNPVDASVEIPV